MEYPALCESLQASGIPSNLHRDMVTGCLAQLGLNIGLIYGTQEIKHICDLIKHGTIEIVTSHHLRDGI